MKLSSEARAELKRRLRGHPDIREHVPKLHDLNRLTKDKLIRLAEKLGLDVAEVAEKDSSDWTEGLTWLTPEDRDRWRHSHKHPAFHGVVEFDLRLALLDIEVTRKARVTYSYTPEWEYFDLHQDRVMEGWAGSTRKLEILAVPEGEVWERKDGQSESTRATPKWTNGSELLEIGVMSEAMDIALDATIEKQCRNEDRRRRRTAKK